MNANPLILQTIFACIIKPLYIKKISCVGRTKNDDYWLTHTGWPNILWQNIILQLSTSCHEYRSIFWVQLNVLLVCLTIQIKRGMLWDQRDLWCGLSACASFNSWVTSAIPVFTTNTPEPTQTGRSTGFWVAIQFDWHNNSARCIGDFKQFNYAGSWGVTSLCIVVSAIIQNYGYPSIELWISLIQNYGYSELWISIMRNYGYP